MTGVQTCALPIFRDQAGEELADSVQQAEAKGQALAGLEDELRRARRRKGELEREYELHRDTLAANETFQLVEQLKREIEALGQKQAELGRERDRVTAAAAGEARALQELQDRAGEDLLRPAEKERLAELTDFLGQLARGTAPEAGEHAPGQSLEEGRLLLGAISARVNEALWGCRAELKKLQEEEQELRRDLASLRNKKFIYDPRVTGLRDLITESFRRRNQEVVPAVLCELLEVPDEKWQDAVEGWLNTQRFDLIVEPEHFNYALGVYERHKKQHNISGVGLVNTGRVLKFLGREEKGALAEEIGRAHV